jgi:predicted RNase H-like nuclease (RuvC/YqgF family)
MAAEVSDSSASAGSAAINAVPDGLLARNIKETEDKIEKLEAHMDDLNKRLRTNDFAGTTYDDRAEAKAALKDLKAEKARLDDRLNTLYETRLTAQQQQSGAGMSMLVCMKDSNPSLPKHSLCMLGCLVWVVC